MLLCVSSFQKKTPHSPLTTLRSTQDGLEGHSSSAVSTGESHVTVPPSGRSPPCLRVLPLDSGLANYGREAKLGPLHFCIGCEVRNFRVLFFFFFNFLSGLKK